MIFFLFKYHTLKIMITYLLITESPAKAKKIQGFLSNEYQVKSSCGHITDLEKVIH